MALRRLLIAFTVVGSVFMGFVWGFARLPLWALAPVVAGFAWLAAWLVTAKYDHDRPALIGAFIAFMLFYGAGAYGPALILSTVLN
jgi:hypothetical protein